MLKNIVFLLVFFIVLPFSQWVTVGIVTTATSCYIFAQDRSINHFISDNIIANIIKINLLNKSSYKNISVNVFEGRVLLTGKVTTLELKNNLTSLLWYTYGIKELLNDIVIDDSDFKFYNKNHTFLDAWIILKLKIKILLTRNTKIANYKIIVKNQIIYLLGIYVDKNELNDIINCARSIKNIVKIKNYIISINDIRRQSFL